MLLTYFSGATLGKGLNRGLATLLAGALGVGVHHLASLSGGIGEPLLLGFFVFLQGNPTFPHETRLSPSSKFLNSFICFNQLIDSKFLAI